MSSRLREIWTSGGVALGGWSTLADPYAAELVCRSGVDWLGVDLQHGVAGDADLAGIVRAADITGTPSLARLAWNDPAAIMRALDLGACGVIVPMVDSAAEAEAAASACRYPPAGRRSWGPVRAALGVPGYATTSANESTLCFVMIETVGGYENVETIAATPGIDGLFVGPNDLALSLGAPMTPTAPDPSLRGAIERVAAVCAGNDIVAGIYCAGASIAGDWARAGYRLIAIDADSAYLARGAAAALAEARSAVDAA
jgi:4-hydroxy-2-oxoheptanedioate aldolase